MEPFNSSKPFPIIMKFSVNNPDLELSPFTGMSREHWIQSAQFLVDGVMQHIKDFKDPVVLPKQHEVSYPKPDDPPWKFKAAEYEGLARTFMAAAPAINARPDWKSNGYHVREYYANQILLACNPASQNYLWKISELKKEFGSHQHYQHTVEGAALVIGLMSSRQEIWDKYTKEEQDLVAGFLSDYAHNRTLSHNWRFFNLIILSFLKLNGYKVDETAIQDHIQHLLSYYTGDGWYRDHLDFDYYNPWAFHFYAPLWCAWYGYEYEPEAAQILEERHSEFMKTYPLFYSRRGHQFMWGRSITYRCAASAALGSAFLLHKTGADPGWTRRTASGNLLQFLAREDIYYQGVPSLGYYRSFEPLVQSYSCAASPFWIAKIYAALNVPADSPFWTARENEGPWEKQEKEARSVLLRGPGLHIASFGSTGCSELRPGKVQNAQPFYNRLSFNTDFPLEMDSPQGATAMTYSLRESGSDNSYTVPLNLAFNREENGVLYRQFNMGIGDEYFGPTRIDLAEIIFPRGVLRIDRLRIGPAHELHLGHYGLPHLQGAGEPVINQRIIENCPVIITGIPGKQLALAALYGWDALDSMVHEGLHPEADRSTVIYAKRTREKDYSGMGLLVSVLLHKTDDEPFAEDDLHPVRQFKPVEWTRSGHPLGADIILRNGKKYRIDFGNIEGNLVF